MTDIPEQDAQKGRDKTRNVASNGKAGFNFTKFNSIGKALPAKATAWDCVRDNVTGLVWEKKPVADGQVGNQGLHDADDGYTWYSTDSNNNGGNPGELNPNGNICFGYIAGQPGTFCNTEAYAKRVNTAGWCGFKDWRLPNRFELRGLVDLSIPYPGQTIDTGYFPDIRSTMNSYYWSSSLYANFSESLAWAIRYDHGSPKYGGKGSGYAVRLVRGGH